MKKATVARKRKFPILPVAIGGAIALYLIAGSKTASAATAQPPPTPPQGGGGQPLPQPRAPQGGGAAPVPPPVFNATTWQSGIVNTASTGTAGQLALRDGPSTSNNVLEWMQHGDAVLFDLTQAQNGFAPTQALDGQTGWASTSYLS